MARSNLHMTVADLQAYLANLADITAAATRSDLAARELRVAAEALEPFATLTVEEFERVPGDGAGVPDERHAAAPARKVAS